MAYAIASIFLIPIFIGLWKLFEKAGRKGWEAIIPIYAFYVMLRFMAVRFYGSFGCLSRSIFIAAAVIYLDFVKSYGKFSAAKQAAALFLGLA